MCLPCNEPPIQVRVTARDSCNAECYCRESTCCFPFFRRKRPAVELTELSEKTHDVAIEAINKKKVNSKK